MWSDPISVGPVVGRTLSSRDTGMHAPVVGVGPLVRVLRVQVVDGQKVGFEPFTGARLVTLRGADAAAAGSARYVIQQFGYSATATRTISMTFDDGPDLRSWPVRSVRATRWGCIP
jgi:hypothetical protein